MEIKYRNPNITRETLQEAGYRRWDGSGATASADAFWQKRVTDEKGIKYYIEFYEYDWSNFITHCPPNEISYEPQCQLKLVEDNVFNVQMLFFKNTIQDIENFVDIIFRSLNCLHYKYSENYDTMTE